MSRRHDGEASPSQFPPPVDPRAEFIRRTLDPLEERIEVGVAIVGGGPAGLACANRLMQLLEDDPALRDRLGEVPVAVIEKGKVCGAHNVSGAMMRPSGLRELFPDVAPTEWPTFGEVAGDAVYWMLGPARALRLRPTPPPFANHGNHVVSISELSRWLAERAEQAGAYVLTETAATQLLVGDGGVRGVRTGDRGRGRDGQPLGNFQPGSDVVAHATVLAEGSAGHLTGAAIGELDLARDSEPQVWALGVKEVWEVPRPLTRVVHTLGWPLRYGASHREFGGSWIYPMGPDRVSLGFVVGLDTTDATVSCHDLLQQFKQAKLVREILEGGRRVAWGARTIPEGGYWAMPKLSAPGLVLCGDSAGMVNVPILKGIHYAIHSGILAAEAIVGALRAGASASGSASANGSASPYALDLSAYEDAVRDSAIARDLYRARNQRQVFQRGFFVGGALANAMLLTGGRFPGGRWSTHRDSEAPVRAGAKSRGYPKPDGAYTFDKLSSVYISGNATRDSSPDNIRVQRRVPREVAEAWTWMCPAAVYEVAPDAAASGPVDVIVNHPTLRASAGRSRPGRQAHAGRGWGRTAVPRDVKPGVSRVAASRTTRA